jgi:uncharacterized membrane protein YuzA (DUF378 family)
MKGFVRFLLALALLGAINWGLIGFFNYNLVDAIFGGGANEAPGSLASRIVYAIVGVAGLIGLFTLPRLVPVTNREVTHHGHGHRVGV